MRSVPRGPPDGERTLECGTVMQTWADGFTIQRNVDGSSMELRVDGSRLARFPSGIEQLTRLDGYLLQTWGDGRRLEQFADGRRIQTELDGSVIELAADGTPLKKPKKKAFRRRKSSLRGVAPLLVCHKTEAPTTAHGGGRRGRRTSSFVSRATVAPSALSRAPSTLGAVNESDVPPAATSTTAQLLLSRARFASLAEELDAKKKALQSATRKLSAIEEAGVEREERDARRRSDSVAQSERLLRTKLKSTEQRLADALQTMDATSRRMAELEALLARASSAQLDDDKGGSGSGNSASAASTAPPSSPDARVAQLLREAAAAAHAASLARGASRWYDAVTAIDRAIEEVDELAQSGGDRMKWPRGWDPIEREEEEEEEEEVDTASPAVDDDEASPSPPRTPATAASTSSTSTSACGQELWLRVAAMGDAQAACALSATTSALRTAVVRSAAATSTWHTMLAQLTDVLYGRWALEEVLTFLDEDALRSAVNPMYVLCERVALCACIGVPTIEKESESESESESDEDEDEEDEEEEMENASHIIIELGKNAVRIGANTPEFESAPVVASLRGLEDENDDDGDPTGIEQAIRLAAERLMGSARYLRGVSVLLVEGTSLFSRANEVAIAEALFQTFAAASVRLVRSGETSIVTFGELSGVVVDAGHDFIHIVPIFEMCALTYANVMLPFGGEMVTQRLQRTLHARGFAFSLNTVEHVKRQACCVRPGKGATEPKLVVLPIAHAESSFYLSGFERSECTEVLFEPAREGLPVGGLARAIYDCVQRCPIDTRRALLGCICLTGGCSAIPGLQGRLQHELDAIALRGISVRVRTPMQSLREGDAPLTATKRTALFTAAAYIGAHVMTAMLDADQTADGFVELADYEEDSAAALRTLIGQRA